MRSLSTVLINRDYARLWTGQAISTLGDYAFNTTLVLWVATVLARARPWAPAAVSGVVITAGAAVLVVGPLAGVFVDRWDRRRIMLGSEVIRAILVGLLTLLSLLPVADLPRWAWLAVIYVVVFVLNAAGQFFSPARFATIGDIVSGEVDRARAAGLSQATNSTAAIIGPPIAAPLLFTIGLQWALLFNTVSYVVSFIAIRSVNLDHGASPAKTASSPAAAAGSARPGVRHDFLAGLRFFASSRFLVALLSVAAICQFGTGALSALGIFFVTDDLHASSHLYGYLGTAMGIGGIVGALCAGRVVKRLGSRRTTCLGLIVAGLLIIAYSRQTVFIAGIALLFAVAVPVTMMNTAMTPLLLASAPRKYLGRVMAVFNPLVQLASMLSVAISGWLASSVLRNFSGSVAGVHLGPIDTIFAGSGALVVIAGLYAILALPQPAAQPAGPRPASPAAAVSDQSGS
jgi:MFS family permease